MGTPSARCYVGTSGWVYPHWQDVFYPAGLPQREWFSYYAQHFDTVEINYTFYRLPDEAAFQRWRDQAGARFVYAVKVSRYITHMRKLNRVEGALERFLGRARLLAEHLGPLLYQLPPYWHCDLGRLEGFLRGLPTELLHSFEFRHPSWFCPEVFDLLERYGAVLCILSMPGLESPLRATGRAVYLRLHGSTSLYSSCYSDQELARWAGLIDLQRQEGRDVYVYFNNDAFGYAVENARQLRRLLGLERA